MPPRPRGRRPARPDAPLRRYVWRRTGEGLVVAVPALALLVTLGVDLAREEAFLERARTTTAEVVVPDDRRGPDLVGVRFDADGREVRTVLTVFGDPDLRRGDTLEVRYDPADPSSVRAADAGGDATSAAVPAAVASLVLLVLAAVLLVRPRRRAAAARRALAEPAQPFDFRLVEGFVLLRPPSQRSTPAATLAVPLLPEYRRPDRAAGLPASPGTAQVHGDARVGGTAVPVVDGVPLWPRRPLRPGDEAERDALPPPSTGWQAV